MSTAATPETLEAALEAARSTTGNTLLVLISPRQAERLLTALKVADKLIANDLTGCTMLALRYQELSK